MAVNGSGNYTGTAYKERAYFFDNQIGHNNGSIKYELAGKLFARHGGKMQPSCALHGISEILVEANCHDFVFGAESTTWSTACMSNDHFEPS